MSSEACRREITKIPVIDLEESEVSPRPEVVYGLYEERQPQGWIRRSLWTLIQLLALLIGEGFVYVREMRSQGKGWQLRVILLRFILAFTWPFMNKDIISKPFPVQFRRRLELMGPSYIKLGQILSLREDILPKSITEELKNLLRQAPVVPFERFKELIEKDLKRPVEDMFSWIDPVPLGSGSLAQTHRARLQSQEEVVIKVLKPGVRKMVETDTKLLTFFGRILQTSFLSRYQPYQLTKEFSRYSLREVDMRIEADNAEIFAANFMEEPRVRFPKIYRMYSNREVLTMEYFRGKEIDAPEVMNLSPIKKTSLIDIGIKAIIQMIFKDGFFHADLHPANIIVLGKGKIGFIDLGMVGEFDSILKRRMFYYFYALVEGDAGNAARYLTAISHAGRGGDPDGFRRAVEDLNRRYLRHPSFEQFSLGQLVLESVKLAASYRIQYPGEIILMIKALVTVEGVGHQQLPDINVVAVSKKHIRNLLIEEFNPIKIAKDSVLVIPEILDTIKQSPLYINELKQLLEEQVEAEKPSILADIMGTVFGSVCLLTGAILAAFGLPWWLWGWFFLAGFSIAGYDFISRR
ncbi:MAG: AarF/UbiB family protein [Methanotrichaceae archaeon]|nr:AarF/UbiB family protein [Methanotrichaceae archaeon]